ncbi:disease resistance protein RFL1-like [Oryza sativa Japonica Group]|uniref:disease resistance protein RFL1-like n=1 Tax=Oryza sativa subsp. japonica TaxID=39947 RepID=UPI00339BE6DE
MPQNFHIHRDVTYFWIAEGFVKKEGSRPIQEVAEDYYHELIMRNLLQARPEYIDKGISTMHDLLRLLGQYLTRDVAVFMDEDETPPNVRRLAVGNAVEEIPGIQDQKNLRCLLVYHHDACRSVKRDIYRKLEHLRILILVGAGLQSIPESVGHLVLLRLLDVSFFQDGTGGFRLDELDSLSKIRRLLLIKLEKASPPASPVLCNKRHLKELGLTCTMGEEADCRTSYEDSEVKNIEEIYNKLCPSRKLQYIFIDGFPELPPAGQLPMLQVLHVKGADAVVSIGHELFGKGVVSPTHTIIFPKLELLEIVDMYNWQSWYLQLINCPKLRALPEDLHRIVNLRRVLIEGVHSLQEIVYHPGIVWLKVKNNKSLRRISNLSKLQLLLAQDCSELQQAEELSSLKTLYMVDCPMEQMFWDCFSKEQQSMMTHVVVGIRVGYDSIN